MKKIILILSIIWTAQTISAQISNDTTSVQKDSLTISALMTSLESSYTGNIPSILPQTAQAAALARYGEYPVSHATGVPQIDIPLYEIKAKDINIPITISYHASGIKVEDVATPVGLGWVLNSGGVITRSICGAVDKQGYTNNKVKSVQHAGELMQNKGVDIYITWKQWGRGYLEDTQSDRYIYNFNGKLGVFRYNSLNNTLVTIPYAPLIIEATSSGFKIKDTDGLIYFFECMETRSLDYIMHTGAWYVTKIESQLTGSIVNYKYKQGTSYKEYMPLTVCKKGSEYYVSDYTNPHSQDFIWGINERPYTWEDNLNLNFTSCIPQLIDEITWDNNKIKFNYTTDRLDKYKDRLNSIEINTNNNIINRIIFNNNSYWGDNEKNYRMRLNGIAIKGSNTSSLKEQYQFKYDMTNLPDYHRREIIGDQIYCKEDYWGYYNGSSGTSMAFAFIPNEYALFGGGANRNPNKDFMQACILKEIMYPTGGNTIFEYEPNIVAGGYDYPGQDYVGGLRVKSITSKTNGQEVCKTYEYSGFVNQPIQSNMFQYSQDRIYSFLNRKVPQIFEAEWIITTSNPIYSITGWSTSPIFYDTVTEYIGTSQVNIGKKVFKYKKNIREASVFPEYPSDIYNQNLYRFWSPYYNYDQGLLSPLLMSENTYELSENRYTLKKQISNEYFHVDMGHIICGVRLSFRNDWIHEGDNPHTTYPFNLNFPYNSVDDFFYRDLECYDLIAYRYFYLLNKSQTIEYNQNGNINTIVTYSYDPDYRLLSPIKTTLVNSDNTNIEESITHPFNMSTAPYLEMTQNHIINPVIKKSKLANSSLISLQNNYRKENSKFIIDNIQTGTNNNLEIRLQYHNYDSYGNPLYISKDDSEKIVYLWSYNGQYPVAEIKNATYEQVKTALGVTPESLSSANIPDMVLINSLRSKLPNSLITTYTYKPLIGIESITDPRGVKTTYGYDDFGRLEWIKDSEGKLIESYKYHYQNQ